MLKSLIISIRSLIVLTLLTGVVYPLLVTAFGQFLFSKSANGSLIYEGEKLQGSKLISQKFESPKYFSSRPSASDYGTVPSGASNLGPTSAALKDAISQRQKSFGPQAPSDLVTTSASGLDPHLTIEGATCQIERVAEARGLTLQQKSQLQGLIESHVEEPILGFIGKSQINILELNIALDKLF